jgi:hypothetical protein
LDKALFISNNVAFFWSGISPNYSTRRTGGSSAISPLLNKDAMFIDATQMAEYQIFEQTTVPRQ